MKKFISSFIILFTTYLLLTGCQFVPQPINNPFIVVNQDFALEYEVGSEEPNWLDAVIVTDTEDGLITLTNSNVDVSKVNMNVLGEFNVTFTVEDSNNNKSTKVITIKIVDKTKPVISGLGNIIIELGDDEPDWLAGVTANDNYDGPITLSMANVDKSNVNLNVKGNYKVTYSVSDSSGNIATQIITVSVISPQDPIIYGLHDLTIEVGSVTPDWLAGITAFDAYNNPILLSISNIDISNVNLFVVGVYTVTFTVSDNYGHSTIVSFNVNVVDTTAPVIEGLSDKQFEINSQAPDWLAGITAHDNYDGEIILSLTNIDLTNVNMNVVGIFTVTYSVTDANGNNTSQTINVTIIDTPDPIINGLHNLTFEVKSQLPNWLTGVSATDGNGNPITLTESNVDATNVNMNVVGNYTVTFTVSDLIGNTTTQTIQVAIVDTTAPTFSGLHNYILAVNSPMPNWLDGITASDNYDGNIPLTINNVDLSNLNMSVIGAYTVSYFVRDTNGNEARENIIVTIVENQSPTINGLHDLTLEVNSNEPDWLLGVSATDSNGTGLTLTLNNVDLSSLNMNELGIYTVTYTVTGSNGNITTESIIVTIVDTTNPEIYLIGNSEVYVMQGREYKEFGVTAIDNYDNNINIVITGTVDISTLGDYQLTYTASDSSGNTASVTRVVHVILSIDYSQFIIDPNLKQAIQDELGHQIDDPIYGDDIDSLTYLDASNYDIDDLSGIEYFVNIERFYLYNNNISNLYPLVALTKLNILDLELNNIDDLTPLQLLYDNGAFRVFEYIDFNIYLKDNPIDLMEGTVNYNIIDYLVGNNVSIDIASTVLVDKEGTDFTSATSLNIGDTINAKIGFIFDEDYFTFTLNDETDLTIFTGGNLTLSVEVYDSNQNLIQTAFFGGYDFNALFNITLTPGTYYLKVTTQFFIPTFFIGNYTLTVREYVENPNSPVVTFGDINIENEIRRILNKPTGNITQADCEMIGSLVLSDLGISDLSGIEYLVNLTFFEISGNNITDITKLASLTNLKILVLADNNITDISPLANLTKLEILILSNNNISDLNPLINLANMRNLYLEGNNITNIDALQTMYQNGAFRIKTILNLIFGFDIFLYNNNLDENSALPVINYLYQNHVYVDVYPNYLTDDYGNSSDNATTINYNDSISGKIDNMMDEDWFVFTVTNNIILNVNFDYNDGFYDLYDMNNDILFGLESGVYVLTPGTYYIKVYGYENSLYQFNISQTTLNPNSPVVTFVDPNLERIIRERINGYSGTITQEICQLITYLYADNENISDLSGIEYFSNLTELYLQDNNISDIAKLLDLDNLEYLYIEDNLLDLSNSSDDVNIINQLVNNGCYVDVYYMLDDEFGNSFDEATTININSPISGNIDFYDEDYMKFTITQNTLLEITTDDDINFDLYRSTYESMKGLNYVEFILTPGTYYINVWGYYTTSYTLTFNQTILDPSSPIVTFVDSNLELAVRDALDVPSAQVTQEMCSFLTTLEASYYGINNLTGIEYLINLIELYLDNNEISEISKLINLPHLEYLTLANNDLDLTENSSNMIIIEQLISNGVQIDITEPDPWENIANATNVTLNSNVNSSFLSDNKVNWYKLVLTQLTNVKIYTTGNLDTVGVLYDEYYTEIINNDESLDSNFEIIIQIPAGTYYIKVTEYFGNNGNYQLHIENCVPQTIPSNEISVNSIINSSFTQEYEEVYYKFTLTNSATIIAYTESDLDTFGYLLDINGNEITTNDNGFIDDNFLIHYYLTPGTYYLVVSEYYGETGDYTFYLQSYNDGNESKAQAIPLSQNDINAQIDYYGDTDWYVITVNSIQTVQIYTNSDLDTVGTLYDNYYNIVADNDDDPQGTLGNNFRIEITLNPGVYYLQVSDYDEFETGTYTLSMDTNHSA